MATEEQWMAKVQRTDRANDNERYELTGDPSYIWEQCGFWLSDTAVRSVSLERVK